MAGFLLPHDNSSTSNTPLFTFHNGANTPNRIQPAIPQINITSAPILSPALEAIDNMKDNINTPNATSKQTSSNTRTAPRMNRNTSSIIQLPSNSSFTPKPSLFNGPASSSKAKPLQQALVPQGWQNVFAAAVPATNAAPKNGVQDLQALLASGLGSGNDAHFAGTLVQIANVLQHKSRERDADMESLSQELHGAKALISRQADTMDLVGNNAFMVMELFQVSKKRAEINRVRLDCLKKSMQMLQLVVKDQASSIEESEKSHKRVVTKLEEVEKENATLSIDQEKQSKRVDLAEEKARAALSALEQQGTAHAQHVQSVTAQLDQFLQERQRLQNQYEKLSNESQALQNALQEELEAARQHASEEQSKNVLLSEEHIAKLTDLEARLSKSEEECTTLSSALSQNRERIHELQRDLEKSQEEGVATAGSLADCEAALRSSHVEKENLAEELHNVKESSNEKIRALEATLQALTLDTENAMSIADRAAEDKDQMLKWTEAQLSQAVDQIKKLEGLLSDTEQRLAQVKQSAQNQETNYTQLVLSLEQEVVSLKKSVQSQSISFEGQKANFDTVLQEHCESYEKLKTDSKAECDRLDNLCQQKEHLLQQQIQRTAAIKTNNAEQHLLVFRDLEFKLDACQASLEEERHKVSRIQLEQDDASRQLLAIKGRNNELSLQVSESEARVVSLQLEKDDASRQILAIEERNKELSRQVSESEALVVSLQLQKDDASQEILATQERNNELSLQVSESKARVVSLLSEVATLQEKNSESQNLIAQLENRYETLEMDNSRLSGESTATTEKLQHQVLVFQEKNAESQSLVSRLQERIAVLEAEVHAKEQSTGIVSKAKADLESDYKSKYEQAINYRTAQHNADMAKVNAKLEAANREKAQYFKEKETLLKSMESLTMEKKQSEELQATLLASQGNLDQQTQVIAGLQAQLASLREQKMSAEANRDSLAQRNRELNDSTSRLTADLASLGLELERMRALQAKSPLSSRENSKTRSSRNQTSGLLMSSEQDHNGSKSNLSDIGVRLQDIDRNGHTMSQTASRDQEQAIKRHASNRPMRQLPGPPTFASLPKHIEQEVGATNLKRRRGADKLQIKSTISQGDDEHSFDSEDGEHRSHRRYKSGMAELIGSSGKLPAYTQIQNDNDDDFDDRGAAKKPRSKIPTMNPQSLRGAPQRTSPPLKKATRSQTASQQPPKFPTNTRTVADSKKQTVRSTAARLKSAKKTHESSKDDAEDGGGLGDIGALLNKTHEIAKAVNTYGRGRGGKRPRVKVVSVTSNSVDMTTATYRGQARKLPQLLGQIAVAQNAPLAQRQFAAVTLKNYVDVHWTSKADNFVEPETSPEVKQLLRDGLIHGLGDPQTKIRVAVANVVSKIAHVDWPELWPNLFEQLLAHLDSGHVDRVHGAMRVLTEFVRDDITIDAQFPTLGPLLLPPLLRVYEPRVRARSIVIFRELVNLLYLVYEQQQQEGRVDAWLTTHTTGWLECFAHLLANPSTPTEEIFLKLEVMRTLDKMEELFPKYMSPYLPSIMGLVSNHISALCDQYVIETVNPTNDSGTGPEVVDSEGEVVGLTTLLHSIFEFVEGVSKKKVLRSMFTTSTKKGSQGASAAPFLKELSKFMLTYMQITQSQEESWENDVNQFVQDDEEETYSFTIRVAIQELLLNLVDTFREETTQAITAAVVYQIDIANERKNSGSPAWWKIHESCLLTLGRIAEPLVEGFTSNSLQFDLAGFLDQVVLPDLNQSEFPYLQGRALWFTSQLASSLPKNVLPNYISAAVEALNRSPSVAVQIFALKAINNFCHDVDDVSVMKPFQQSILEGLVALSNDASEDTMTLILNCLNYAIKIDISRAGQIVAPLAEFLVRVWKQYKTDPIVSESVLEIIEVLASNAEITIALQNSMVPSVMQIMASEKALLLPGIQATGIDVLKALLGPNSGPVSPLYSQFFPDLMGLFLHSEDTAILQNAAGFLRSLLQRDMSVIIDWSSPDANGLQLAMSFLAKLLNPNASESAGLFLGDLIIKFIQKAGQHIAPVLHQLLSAIAFRLSTAQLPTFIQSLVLVFAHLIKTQRDDVVIFLAALNIEGVSALEIFVKAWCENFSEFTGYYPLKLNATAMSQLFQSTDPRLHSIMVKGDEIVTDERIRTRSSTKKAPHQFTTIPFSAKAIKLLLTELMQNVESNMGKPSALRLAMMGTIGGMVGESDDVTSDSDEEDEGEEEGEDDWEDVDEGKNGDSELRLLSDFADRNDFEDEDDLDLRSDPIYQLDLKEYLVTFFKTCYAQDTHGFRNICTQFLSASERDKLSNRTQQASMNFLSSAVFRTCIKQQNGRCMSSVATPSKQHLVSKSGVYPHGFLAGGVASGIKKKAGVKDMAMVISPEYNCTVAGVFTTNAFASPSVQVDKSIITHLKGTGARGVVVNAGCANACTGDQGLDDAWKMGQAVDAALKSSGKQAIIDGKSLKGTSSPHANTLVMSTGVIGQHLPMPKIYSGISSLVPILGSSHQSWSDAATAIMTTDTFPKLRSKEITTTVNGKPYTYRMAGWCKGAGMIHPNMATMLSSVFTDISITRECLDNAIKHAADWSFNAISVDGDSSTNDTFLLFANGGANAANGYAKNDESAMIRDVNSTEFIDFRNQFTEFSVELSKLIVRDGEGATKFMDILVQGARTFAEAKQVANTIAKSPLVKTAIYGRDANWGRIICAVGYSGIKDIDPTKVNMHFGACDGSNSLHLFKNGAPFEVNEEVAAKILSQEDISIRVDLGMGKAKAQVYTCDFSHDYISINADYRS
ncbi:hypothetical protein SmJEL517_g02299 [Synchytrium microbalum]|uniref:Arginine biosynthesis bifunctional protein ArgJ, mitochondrial n=1 Tax=Synchytrium microbalum TaxID=1806994 RepID=A0A507CBA8_9FUNG|nr:uncharacterized protein SmJEL517_g02299 [Synchytrium microbalum]TPX35286.1 hypothetical protein SmJEL517_g02299 [Synchytrium microbalum]